MFATSYLLRLYSISVFFLTCAAIFAQTGSIKGKIIDAKTNEPLIGASVIVDETTNGAAADLDGNFVINNVAAGAHTLTASYVAYQSGKKTGVVVERNKETVVDFLLNADDISLQAVEVVAKANRESENILLMEQRKALVATQAVGARELSRKGIGNAEAAVAQVSGISRQEGVKNVFVRGLGDRYNATFLNGLPIPSEDPEYKNIALEFFGTDVIQNIGVSKVFSGSNGGDAGGAIIDISSKELGGDYAFNIEASAGINSATVGKNFLRQHGSGYFGFANNHQPAEGVFDFPNKLDPAVVKLPLSHSYGLSGGKRFLLGENRNPLTFFVVASHSSDNSYTHEIVRNTDTGGGIIIDQQGEKYSQNTNQLALANVTLGLNRAHQLSYNFMMVHANNQYLGKYAGVNTDKYQSAAAYNYEGFFVRQQTNDNLLLTHQLLSAWKLSDKLQLNAGASYNTIAGKEPDRRFNHFYRASEDTYVLTGSNSQKRFFSTLNETDLNVKTNLTYQLPDKFGNNLSNVQIGYNGRFVKDDFHTAEYDFTAVSKPIKPEILKLDELYNAENLANGLFRLSKGEPNTYQVSKYIHSAYVESSYQFASNLVANAGVRFDKIDLSVSHHTQGMIPGTEELKPMYVLPSLNLKYDLNDKNSLRLGASKSYTLPQSKEIAPYTYVALNFNSQGNKDLQPSENYNIDLKWDYYLSPSELISVTGFYKHIVNPIARAEEGSSGGYLTYKNISKFAAIAGAELEVRKNIFSLSGGNHNKVNRLSVGLNASYIYSRLEVNLANTEPRKSALEGAAPFITNIDLSYTYMNNDKTFTNSLVFNYFSDRIYTIGTLSYKDIIEKGAPTLNFVSSAKINKNLTFKLKAANLLNPNYELVREATSQNGNIIVLSRYKKGIDVSLGVSYDF